MSSFFRHNILAVALTLAFSLCAFAPFGCTAGPKPVATMRLASQSTRAIYSQRFTKSHATDRSESVTEIVLTDSPGEGLRQLMHLRLQWRPMRGTKNDQPSTTNAVIDWYVWDATTTDGPPAVNKYTGAGLVMADRLPAGLIRVTVKNATLTLRSQRGNLADPVGPATLTGTFITNYDTAEVDGALATIPAGAPRAAAGAMSNQPR